MLGINGVMENAKSRQAVKLTPPAKEVVARWSVEMDMSEQGVASRIIAWLGRQPDEIQRAVLGMYGSRAPDIARIILEEMTRAGPQQSPAGENGVPGKPDGAVVGGKRLKPAGG